MTKRRDKGEGGIYQRSDGYWCMSIELPSGPDGKRKRKVVCRKDKAAVIVIQREQQAELKKHGTLATKSLTVEAWMNQWVNEIAPLDIRPRTLAGYRTVVDGYIIPILGKKKLDKLNPDDVRRLHTTIQTTPKDRGLRGKGPVPEGTVMLSSTYALLAHNTLSVALQAAVREKKMTDNPCNLVKRPRKRLAEQKALDAQQAMQLLAHLTGRLDGAMWITFLLTGARRGEILGLEADRVTDSLDLSWQLQRITDISKAPADWEYRELGSTLYLTRPKSNAGWRVIPLVEPLKSVLALHMNGQKDGLVFKRDGRPWDPDRATKEWTKVLQDAGLPTDIVLHGARHTVVDLLYAAKVHESDIMQIVGHSNRAVTRGYRSRGNTEQLTEAMKSLSNQFM